MMFQFTSWEFYSIKLYTINLFFEQTQISKARRQNNSAPIMFTLGTKFDVSL